MKKQCSKLEEREREREKTGNFHRMTKIKGIQRYSGYMYYLYLLIA